ncbi:MAG TPA: 30S ribosomal protein S6 [bacterium]|nr:30S ribosomal protein S6 [bacterium]HPS28665.1 30S ribosomal protein S6 [bacterium]
MERRHYELTAILKPEGGAEAVKQFAERVDNIVNEFGGKTITLRSWGEKKLAYEIKKNMKGHYLFFDLVGDGRMIEEIERNFNIWEHVIKFMSIKVEKRENLDELTGSAKGISTLFEKIEKKAPVVVVAEPVAPVEEDKEKKSLEDSRKYNEELQKSLTVSTEEDDNVEL